MIKAFMRELREWYYLRRVQRLCELSVSPTAKVSYRGSSARPPASLKIGDGSIFQGTVIGEREGAQVSIGARTFIGASTIACAQRVDIGDDVLISWGCTLIDHHSHALFWDDRANDVERYYDGEKDWSKVKILPIRIENKAWIGFNTIVLAGVTIGEGAVVGCGSIVTKDVPSYAVVAGNPARIIRANTRMLPKL